jgi:UDP-N-acetylglucosamine 4,6-dehydratase
MNIMDLAHAIAPECDTKVIGIRPGEKLHEVMVPRDDALNTLEYDDYYLIMPALELFEASVCRKRCKPVPDDFEYSSRDNPQLLSVEQLRKMI